MSLFRWRWIACDACRHSERDLPISRNLPSGSFFMPRAARKVWTGRRKIRNKEGRNSEEEKQKQISEKLFPILLSLLIGGFVCRWSDHYDELAFERTLLGDGQQLRGFAAQIFLEFFCQLA